MQYNEHSLWSLSQDFSQKEQITVHINAFLRTIAKSVRHNVHIYSTLVEMNIG